MTGQGAGGAAILESWLPALRNNDLGSTLMQRPIGKQLSQLQVPWSKITSAYELIPVLVMRKDFKVLACSLPAPGIAAVLQSSAPSAPPPILLTLGRR